MAAADGGDAASGALGAVVGEITAEELSVSLEKAVLTGEIGPDTVLKWGARNVDLAKLAAGLAAAAAGMDVNTAAQTGGNAAQNNVGHILAALAATAAILAAVAEIADKGVQTHNAIEFCKAYIKGDMAKAEEYATELAWSLGTDAVPGNAVLIKIFNKFGLVALGTKIGQKVEKVAVATGAKFVNNKRLVEHFKKHGADFGAKSPAEYEKLASDFLKNVKPQGVLEKVRPSDGAIVRYNPKTEEFGIFDKSGMIKTYYKPQPGKHPYKTNMEYYDAQR